MLNQDFLFVFYNNIGIFFICLLLSFLFFYFFFRHIIKSILDPSFYSYVTLSCADAVVLFLWFLGYISNEKFIYVLLSELSFWIAFVIFKDSNRGVILSQKRNLLVSDEKKLFNIFFIYIIICNLINFSIAGIPLFHESRFMVRQIPIVALLNRTLLLPTAYCWIYVFHLFFISKGINNILRIFFTFIILALFSLATGSKGFILKAVYFYFIYYYFYYGKAPLVRIKYLIIIALSPLLVTFVYYGLSDFKSGFSLLLFRFVASGDGYWMGFTDNIIDYINNTASWWERVFSFILGPLQLISSNAKIPIGTLILNYLNPATEGLLEGPNSRIPIFTYACLGWLGIVLSYIYGYVFSKLLNFCDNISCQSILRISLIGLIYINCFSIITDPLTFGSGLIDIIFCILIINLLSKLIFQGRGYYTFFK